MKRLALTLMAAMLAFPALQAQEESPLRHHSLKVGLAPTLLLQPQLSYEYRFEGHSAINVDFAPMRHQADDKHLFLHLQYRYYFSSLPNDGLFLACGLNNAISWLSYERYVRNEGWNIISEPITMIDILICPTLSIGYKAVSNRGFTVEPTLGFRLGSSANAHRLANTYSFFNHISTLTALRFGWTF